MYSKEAGGHKMKITLLSAILGLLFILGACTGGDEVITGAAVQEESDSIVDSFGNVLNLGGKYLCTFNGGSIFIDRENFRIENTDQSFLIGKKENDKICSYSWNVDEPTIKNCFSDKEELGASEGVDYNMNINCNIYEGSVDLNPPSGGPLIHAQNILVGGEIQVNE